MPWKPFKPCKNPRCPNLVDPKEYSGYCEQCKPRFLAERAEHDKQRRAKEAKRPHISQRPGYGPEWIKAREKYRATHPYCELCGKPAELVHHRKPVEAGGGHEQENLVALCNSCHNRIEPRGWGRKR